MLPRQFIGKVVHITIRRLTYVQGQTVSKNIREYFYFVDHQGQLFLDDARIKNFTSCFKDKEFLVFFFNHLRKNDTERYNEFPFVSLCGRERNYVRCDDLPIVYTHILKKPDSNAITEHLAYCNAGDRLTVPFQPEKLCMLPDNGRVYYPANVKFGGVGLVKSMLAIELSKHFIFEDGQDKPPTKIQWSDQDIKLTNEVIPVLKDLKLLN